LSALPLGDKSRLAIACDGFLTVYEGSVRSAKTVTSLVQWYRYVLSSPENVFLMSGNTLGSISRNCIIGDYGFVSITGGKAQQRTDTDGSKFLQLGKKKIYYCGADNIASFKKIRGLSIGGWYADEINLHHRDFIETAFARSFASQDRQNIWTLNPDAPNHWIYGEYIDKYLDDKTAGYNYFHFTLDDNPALSETRKAEIASQFTGVFYKRYVLGLRVRAEGQIYTSFSDANIIDELPKNIYRVTLALDFGGNKSATAGCAVGWYLEDRRLKIVILDEFYDTKNKSVESIHQGWKTFCQRFTRVERCFGDSAEQLIIKSLNADPGLPHMDNAMKRPVLDRIRLYDMLFAQDRAKIMRKCKETISAFENACWDDKASEDVRLDNGTTNIDSLDAAEYAIERDMTELIDGGR
jgi:PBSX family phage terminase large subunit